VPKEKRKGKGCLLFIVDKGKRGGGKRVTKGQAVLEKRGINCKR
jgi:hypothetical protein